MLPAVSKATPEGRVDARLLDGCGTVLPPATSWAAANLTTFPSATTETQRLPSRSNVTTLAPGIALPNVALFSVKSGVFTPSLASIAAG